jgi:hypothetical protein
MYHAHHYFGRKIKRGYSEVLVSCQYETTKGFLRTRAINKPEL